MFHAFGYLLISLGGVAACAVMANEFRARWRDMGAALVTLLPDADEGKESRK